MSYCLNPDCKQPQNPDDTEFCLNCSSKLLLKDQYRAIRPLGAGMFGRTFLAEDAHRMNDRCAIKQFSPLPQIQANAEAMAKATQVFEREAKQLLELGAQYPQIPTLFAYFEQDKRLYVVQQYIEGQNLWQELQEQGAFNEHQVRELLQDLLPVLQLLHNRQMVHREIKPTNILRRKSDRRYVLIDFGVSKQLADTRLTKTGSRINTEVYASMEQLRSSKTYPSSDLYSLGVICVQMLAGGNLDDLYDPLEGRWIWREYLGSIGSDVSNELGQVLDKLLKDLVKERYQSAVEVLRDLYGGTVRRNIGQPKLTPQQQQKIQGWRCLHTIQGHLDTVTAVNFSSDGKMLASSSADKTIKIWQSDTGKLVRTLMGHGDTVTSVAFSSNEKILVSGSADKTIKIWQVDSGKLIRTLTGHSVTVFSVALSQDGEILASGSGDGTIKLWDGNTGKQLGVLTGHSDFVESVAFSREGHILASGSWDNTIKIWQLAMGGRVQGNLLHALKGHTSSIWSVAFSPDGQTLASNSGDNSIKIWHLTSGTLLRTLTEYSDSAWSVAFSPDGQTLASDSGDNSIKIWHVATGKLLRTLSGHSSQVRSVAFSRDGKTLASGSDDKTIKIWQCE